MANGGARGGLGVYADNRTRAVHRWYPFAEAFSSELIEHALADAQAGALVFDPFGGSGTTAVAACELGFDCYFTEVNPYLAWLASVKVNAAAAAAGISGAPRALEIMADEVERFQPRGTASEHLVTINAKRGFLPEAALDAAAQALQIAEAAEGPLTDLVRLAVAVSLIPASNMIRRTDLRKRTTGDPAPADLRVLVSRKLREIAEDLRQLDPTGHGTARALGADIRTLETPSIRVDRIITSPPYLNGTNYCRNTKLELLLLGFIGDESGLDSLRSSSIAAGINNISKRRASPEEIPEVEKVAVVVDEVTYDARIPALIRGYFSDMQVALRNMRALAATDCTLLLDIGDSKYSGIHVDTPALLASIAQNAGWKLTDRRPLRARRSHDGSALTQDLLSFQAMPA